MTEHSRPASLHCGDPLVNAPLPNSGTHRFAEFLRADPGEPADSTDVFDRTELFFATDSAAMLLGFVSSSASLAAHGVTLWFIERMGSNG